MNVTTITSAEWFARTIVENENATIEVDSARKRYERFEEAWDGLCWLLARTANPIGTQRRHNNGNVYWLHKLAGQVGERPVPSIKVLYEMTSTEVIIIAAEATEPVMNEDDIDF